VKTAHLASKRVAPEAPHTQGSAILAVAACALLWSTGGLFVKLITWNPFAIAGIRSLFGGLVILVFLRRPRFTWSFAQIAGAVCYAACMIGFVTANKLTTAANAILLQYTAPVYAAVLGWLILKEKTRALDWVTMAVVIGGMVLFFLDSILLSHGITLVVSIPFLWQSAPSLAGWGALAFLGIFQIGLSSILLNYGVKHVTAVQTLLTAVLEPLFNPIWVFLVLGERPGPRALVGGAIILVAVTLRSVISLRSAMRPVAAG
jgi:drug/metabolite transporter (DMT)-like permease